MYLKDSKTVVIKIGSSLIINESKSIREKWLSDFALDIQNLQKLKNFWIRMLLAKIMQKKQFPLQYTITTKE